MPRIEWDPGKERANRSKHGFGFDEVRSLFDEGTTSLVVEHSADEDRS